MREQTPVLILNRGIAASAISPPADNPPKPWRLHTDLPAPAVAGFAKAGMLERLEA